MKVYIDAGYGAFKYATDEGAAGEIVSHVVRSAREADFALLGMASSKCMAINNGFGKFLVGLGATDHTGHLEDSTDYERITDAAPEVRALFYAAMTQGNVIGRASVVVALPLGLVTLPDAKARIADMKAWMVKEHEWESGRIKRVLNITSVKALSQAQSIYFDHTLGDDGQQRRESDGLIVTISIGSNTVEIMGFEDGQPQPRLASGSKIGMRFLLSMINDSKFRGVRTIPAIDADLRRGKITNDVLAPAMSNWHSRIRAEIKRVIGDECERVDQVVVAGGGAQKALPELRRIFPGGDRNRDRVTIADDPVRAVVRGMVKWDKAQGA